MRVVAWLTTVSLAALLSVSAAWPANAQTANVAADADRLLACIDARTPPEGDLPPGGGAVTGKVPGTPDDCAGLVYGDCLKAGTSEEACSRREALAWLRTHDLGAAEMTRFTPAQRMAYRRGVAGIRTQAEALCRATASVSAWGASRDPTRPLGLTDACVRANIARATIYLHEHRRGN